MKKQKRKNVFERFLRIASVLAFVLILVLPGAQMVFGFVEEEKLVGAVEEVERPGFDVVAWHDGRFQKQAQDWFAQKFGFRGHLVKTDNQISFSVFREINNNARSQVVLGKDRYLYEKGYIDNLNNRDDVPLSVLEERAQQVKKLQSKLEERGIDFLLLLAPSKATVHPEFVPEKYILEHRKDQPTNYEKLVPVLQKHDVEYIDAHEYFVSRKNATSPSFFARGGTHWNYYGLCEFAGAFTQKLDDISGKSHTQVTCSNTKLKNELYGADKDLAHLINLWDKNAIVGPTPYSVVSSTVSTGVYQPEILFVGDSFLWTLTGMFREQEVYVDQEMYYYFNTAHVYEGNKEILVESIDRENWDFEERVFSKDLIIIEVSETGVNDIGFGFVEKALDALESQEKRL